MDQTTNSMQKSDVYEHSNSLALGIMQLKADLIFLDLMLLDLCLFPGFEEIEDCPGIPGEGEKHL